MGAGKNWSQEQVIGIWKQVEAGRTVVEVCRGNEVCREDEVCRKNGVAAGCVDCIESAVRR